MTTERRDNLLDFDDLKKRDDALMKEALDTKHSPYPKLFMEVPDGINAYVRKGDIYTPSLVDDFFGIAREAAERVPEGTDADQKIRPVLFLYRHAVELALKVARWQLIHVIHQHEPDFKPDGVDDKHQLGVLLGDLRGLHKKAQPYLKTVGRAKFISEQAEAFITEMDRVDPEGTGFRYSHALNGQIIVEDADIGIDALILGMQHVRLELDRFAATIDNSGTLIDERNADRDAEDGGY